MAIKMKEHGISVAIKRCDDSLFIEIKMIGKLTHQDYQTFLPILEKSLKEAKGLKIDLLADMTDFKGWKLRAAWDDMVFGLKYRNFFSKMAIVGNKKWEEISVNMFKPFAKGKVSFFKDRSKALKWLFK